MSCRYRNKSIGEWRCTVPKKITPCKHFRNPLMCFHVYWLKYLIFYMNIFIWIFSNIIRKEITSFHFDITLRKILCWNNITYIYIITKSRIRKNHFWELREIKNYRSSDNDCEIFWKYLCLFPKNGQNH